MRWQTRYSVYVIPILVCCPFVSCSEPPQPDPFPSEGDKPPAPIASDVIDSWERHGGAFGWLARDAYCVTARFIRATPTLDLGKTNLPSFLFLEVDEDTFEDVAKPAVPFGLAIHRAEATDEQLQGLETLTTLQALDLFGNPVTDETL